MILSQTMTARNQNPKKATDKAKGKNKKDLSLWERAQLLKPIQGLSQLLDEHELLSPDERKRNILAAQKKGLIKAKVVL